MSSTYRNCSQCIHRGISKHDAEEILLNAKLDGSFLVRESETVEGAFTLCVLHNGKVHQYRILSHSTGSLSIESEEGVKNKKYSDLVGLIQDYVQRGSRNGLTCALLKPISVETSEFFSDDDLDSDVDEMESEVISTQEAGSSTPRNQPVGSLESFVHNYFLQRFTMLDLSSCEGSFLELLRRYVMNGSSRDVHLYDSASELPKATLLHSHLEESGLELMKHLDIFLKKIDLWRHLFGPITTTPLVSDPDNQKTKTLLDLFNRMSLCKSALGNLEKKASLKYKELVRMWKEGGLIVGDSLALNSSTNVKPDIPSASFEVKMASMSGMTKVLLNVDIMKGKLTIIKSSKESVSEKNVFSHDRIEQLVKSNVCSTKLDLKLSGMKKKTFIFEDARQRENFCQFVQQLKNTHSPNPEVNYISLYIGTWNMGGEIPLHCLQSWLKSDGLGKKRNQTLGMIAHDIYVIGTQESSLSDREWSNRILSILEFFGEEFYIVTFSSLWSIRIVVIAKLKHKNRILNVEQSSVKTGIANRLGNKGAVGVSFYFSGTGFCFINSHLTSRSEKLKRRNQNFQDILKALDLGRKCSTDVTNKFHHVFFFGDLNYRIDGLDPLKIIDMIKTCNDNFQSLLLYDQLRKVQQERRVFTGFKEEDISFPPTYRFQKGSRDKYVWEKPTTTKVRINVPSWCDRILWKSYPSTWIHNTSYGSCQDILSSDHKPVFGSFDVKIYSQFSSHGDSPNVGLVVIFQEVIAELKTSQENSQLEITTFQLEISSECFGGCSYSRSNTSLALKEGFVCPKWEFNVLPELHPIIDDLDHLEEQHILVCIQNSETAESYGECVLALKHCFASSPQLFLSSLSHLGEEAGVLKCQIQIKTKRGEDPRNFAKRKTSVDLIYVDAEYLHVPEAESGGLYEDVLKNNPSVICQTPRTPATPIIDDGSPCYSVVLKPTKVADPDQAASIYGWLDSLGLSRYATTLISNGWDNVKFLKHLDDEELIKIGVTIQTHRKMMLDAIANIRA